MSEKEIFAQNLSKLLKDNNLSQRKFAAILGLSVQAVSCWCKGKTYPECSMLLKIAQHFNVSIDYLLTGKTSENKPVREILGLSENACECLKLAISGQLGDIDINPYLDRLLSDKDFYFVFDKSIGIFQRITSTGIGFEKFIKDNLVVEERDKQLLYDYKISMREYGEHKAAENLTEYFMKIFNPRKN